MIDALGAVGADDALDAGLEVAARDVLGARKVTGVPLVALADVEQHDAVAVRERGLDVGGVDLLDRASDLADDLRA